MMVDEVKKEEKKRGSSDIDRSCIDLNNPSESDAEFVTPKAPKSKKLRNRKKEVIEEFDAKND